MLSYPDSFCKSEGLPTIGKNPYIMRPPAGARQHAFHSTTSSLETFMKRLLIPFLGLIICACGPSTAQKTVTILHTNDIHGGFLPREATWMKTIPKPMIGGFSELVHTVDSIRSEHPDALLLDAGDVMTGNPISDIEYGGAQGGALFEMMNRIGYTSGCPGNHDLDISQENLRGLISIQKFPALSANLVNNDGALPLGNKEYVIVERNGVRIGIFGLMLQGLARVVNQTNLEGLRVLSPVETAKRIIAELDPLTDLIVAVTHQGVDDDSLLAASVKGLDVIVGGHSHTRLQTPKVINNVIIVQAGSNAENLGVLELIVDNDRVVRHSGSLLQLWSRADRTTRLSPIIDSLKMIIDNVYAEVIATLDEDWMRGEGETKIGNFITGAMAEAAAAQIGFTNNHGIRKNLSAGSVTKRDLYEVLPFRNTLVTFQLSGKQLRSIIEYYLKRKPAIQISGVICHWKSSTSGEPEIVRIEVGGRPLINDQMYICATNDFFAGQAEKYIGMEISQPVFLTQTMFDAVEVAVRKAKTLTSRVEGRFKKLN